MSPGSTLLLSNVCPSSPSLLLSSLSPLNIRIYNYTAMAVKNGTPRPADVLDKEPHEVPVKGMHTILYNISAFLLCYMQCWLFLTCL